MEKDRKELRKILKDALEGLNEKEEMVERLSKIEKSIDSLSKKIDDLNKKLDSKNAKTVWDDLFDKIKAEPKTNPPWSPPVDWPYRAGPYRSSFGTCVSCEHEYPSPWMAVVPPSCKKCGKPAQDMRSISGEMGSTKGLEGTTIWNEGGSLYLDGTTSSQLRLSDNLHDALNKPIIPPGAGVVSNDKVITNEGAFEAQEYKHYGLTAKPRNKNNAYWKM